MKACPFVLALVVVLGWAGAVRAQDRAKPGPFQAGWFTATVARPGGGSFQASVFYPALNRGESTPFDAAAAPAPGITFGHGFLQPVGRYTSTLEHLATWGFVVVASQSESGLFPSHANFASDMRLCLSWLEQQNQLAGGVFHQRIDVQHFGASGHSMGGGCSILAAAADPRIRAVAPLAAANTTPSAVTASALLTVPVSFIAGTADSIVPTASHSAPMYAASPPPKMLPSIQGGWHCGFQDVSSFGCDSGPLKRSEQLAITRRLLTGFFLLYLKGDQSVWRGIWGPERDADPRIITSADPGISMSPSEFLLERFGGQSGSVAAQVTNTGASAQSFELRADAPGWGLQQGTLTGPLEPTGQLAVAATVQFPSGIARLELEGLLTARSLADGGTRAWRPLSLVRLCRTDLDRSGAVNIADFTAMLTLFGMGSMDADIDGDGVLTVADFSAFLFAFASGCD